MAYTPGDQDKELLAEHADGQHADGMTAIHCSACIRGDDARSVAHLKGKHGTNGDPACVLCLADRREADRRL